MKTKLTIYKYSITLLFISSLHPWFVWGIQDVYLSIGIVICTLLVKGTGYINITKKSLCVSFVYLALLLWSNRGANLFGLGEILLNWFVFINILGLQKDIRKEVLTLTTKCLAIILAISLPFFIVHAMGVSLPHISVTNVNSLNSLENYYFFIKKGGTLRFQGPFLEPGFMTMGSSLLLYLNKYKLRNKYVLILFISQILSMSIAGYFILALGYLLILLLDRGKNNIYMLLTGLCVMLVSSFFLINIMGQDVVEESVVDRLQWEDGKLSGDNRSSEYLDFVYDMVVNSDLKWVGTEWDSEMSEKGVAGFKLYIVKYGYIGLLITLILYLSSLFLLSNELDKKMQTSLIFLSLLLLYQNAYPTMWAVLIVLFYGKELLDAKYE